MNCIVLVAYNIFFFSFFSFSFCFSLSLPFSIISLSLSFSLFFFIGFFGFPNNPVDFDHVGFSPPVSQRKTIGSLEENHRFSE